MFLVPHDRHRPVVESLAEGEHERGQVNVDRVGLEDLVARGLEDRGEFLAQRKADLECITVSVGRVVQTPVGIVARLEGKGEEAHGVRGERVGLL